MRFLPKTYQTPAIEFVKATPRCALHAGIGAGKTVIGLTAVYDLWMGLDIHRALYVAPLNVILNTFPDEVAKWDHTQDMTYSILHGPQKDERIAEDTQVHVINYEGLQWLLTSPLRPFYDMVILDESHWVKDSKTERFKMLRDMLAEVPRIVEMTGSPIGNTLYDLWAQYYLLDKGDRLFRRADIYKSFYFQQVDYQGYKWEPYDWAEVAVIEKVQDITFQVHADDVELTDLTESEIECHLPDKVMKQYAEFERDYFLEYEEAEIEAFNAVSLSSKLRQLANGFLYWGDTNVHNRQCKRFHDSKFEILQEFVSRARQNIMIVCTFQEDFAALQRFFPGIPCVYGRTTPTANRKNFKRWNNKELPLMAIHPRSVGTGLNLQDGGSLQVWLSPDWSYLAKNQTIGRVHRTGQQQDVEIEVIVAQGTIDELILETLKEKTLTTESFAKKLRLYRRAVLGGKI